NFPALAAVDALAIGPDGLDKILPGLSLLYNTFAEIPDKCRQPFVPFDFHVVAAATAMTRDEFIEQSTGEAERLRQAILKDRTASLALVTLAADKDGWRDLFLASLAEGGLLRP